MEKREGDVSQMKKIKMEKGAKWPRFMYFLDTPRIAPFQPLALRFNE